MKLLIIAVLLAFTVACTSVPVVPKRICDIKDMAMQESEEDTLTLVIIYSCKDGLKDTRGV